MSYRNLIRYWGRKPRGLAQQYISQYSKPGEIVADIFGGSGVFVEVALELGRRAIYIDLNPFAELIAHSLIEGCDLSEYQQAIQTILSRKALPVKIKEKQVNIRTRKLFYVKCVCGRNVEASLVTFTRIYQISSNNFSQLKGTKYKIAKIIQKEGQINHDKLCKLNKDITTQSLSSAIKWLVRQGMVKEREVPLNAKLVKPCRCGRTEIKFQNSNIWTIKGPIEPLYWYPKDELRYKNGEHFLKRRDVSSINEFFMDRSLALLSAIWHDICLIKAKESVKRCLCLTFMAILARSSKMCRNSGGTWPINSYWIPRNFVVKNPYIVFENAANHMISFLRNKRKFNCGDFSDVMRNKANIAFKLADSTKVSLPKNSLDYVIIDPPHTDEAQFFELSLLYTSWMKKRLPFENELIVNPKQGKTLDVYMRMLKEAVKRIHYALKPNKCFTIILHEEDPSILKACTRIVCSVGFELLKNDQESNYTVYTFRRKDQFFHGVTGILKTLLSNLSYIFNRAFGLRPKAFGRAPKYLMKTFTSSQAIHPFRQRVSN